MAKEKKANNKKKYNAVIEKKRKKEREQKLNNKAKLKEIIGKAKENKLDTKQIELVLKLYWLVIEND